MKDRASDTGSLYGGLVHPRRLPLSPEAVAMVAKSRLAEVEVLGISGERLRSLRVLECGGTGRDALGWASLGVEHVTHVDLSEENPRNVRQYCADHGIENVESIQGDLLEIDLPAQGWDVVRSRGVMHHLADPALGLARYTYWTKLDGFVHFNVYRGGTFYYYGVKLIRQLVRAGDLPAVLDAMEALGVQDYDAGILLDDFFVPHMHTASPGTVVRDIARAGLEWVEPVRSWAEVDHGILYPDMPEKLEHLQYWCRKKDHREWRDVSPQLEYHQGVDDVAIGRALAGGDVSFAAFQEFEKRAADASPRSRAEALIRIYSRHHYEISTVEMTALERHQRLAECFREQAQEL